MGRGQTETKGTRLAPIRRLLSRTSVEPLAFDNANCPVREHTADGHYIDRCFHSLYGGYCPRHGLLAPFLREDGSGDDRDFPPYGARIWPSEPTHRKQLGVDESAIEFQGIIDHRDGVERAPLVAAS